MGELAAAAKELTATTGPLADHLATAVAARYAAVLADWDGDPAGGIGRKLRVLRALCQEVMELRRGDHSAARLQLEQVRRERDREPTEEEMIALGQRWAKKPAVREAICGKCLSPALREAQIMKVFGLAPRPKPPSELPDGAPESPAPSPESCSAESN